LSDLSDLSDQKKGIATPPEEKRQNKEHLLKSYIKTPDPSDFCRNPLPQKEIEKTWSDEPTPEQIAHARRMMLLCPALGERIHCWWCSRCFGAESGGCKAWRSHRDEVEFFRQSEEPFSLSLAEGVLQ
jgi:hypothetical protein